MTGVFVTDIQWCVEPVEHCHLKVNRKIHHLDFPVDLIVCTATPRPQRCCLPRAPVSKLVLLSRAPGWYATWCLCLLGLRRTLKGTYSIQGEVRNYTSFLFLLSKWLKYCSGMRFLSLPREISFFNLYVNGLVAMIMVMWEKSFQGRGSTYIRPTKGLCAFSYYTGLIKHISVLTDLTYVYTHVRMCVYI